MQRVMINLRHLKGVHMSTRLSTFLLVFCIFPLVYLIGWVAFLLIIYLSERQTNFEAAESFYLTLYFVLLVCLPLAFFAHVVAVILQRNVFHHLILRQTLSAEFFIGIVSAIVPLAIWLINPLVLQSRDEATLWTGIVNLIAFACIFGAPFVSTHFFANFFTSDNEI
ncbi:MAG: hypothetical protein AB1757_25470 [Acidobacteriota bacterium]